MQLSYILLIWPLLTIGEMISIDCSAIGVEMPNISEVREFISTVHSLPEDAFTVVASPASLSGEVTYTVTPSDKTTALSKYLNTSYLSDKEILDTFKTCPSLHCIIDALECYTLPYAEGKFFKGDDLLTSVGKCSSIPQAITALSGKHPYPAAVNGHLEMVEYLTSTYDTTLAEEEELLFMDDGDLPYDYYILYHSYGMDELPIHGACEGGHLEIVKFLYLKYASRCTNSDHQSPLHLAAREGHLNVVEYLLEVDFEQDFDIDGKTPLSLAATGGHVEVAKMLLDNGAEQYSENKEREDRDLTVPIMAAAYWGHIEVVRLLLARNALDYYEGDPSLLLIQASLSGELEIIKLLHDAMVRKDMHINYRIPLRNASAEGHLEVVKYYLSVVRYYKMFTECEALWYAVNEGHLEVAKLLLESGASHVPVYHKTPLYIASRDDNLEMVKLLISFGAQHTPTLRGMIPQMVTI